MIVGCAWQGETRGASMGSCLKDQISEETIVETLRNKNLVSKVFIRPSLKFVGR